MRTRDTTIPIVVGDVLLDPRFKIPIEVTYGYGRFRSTRAMPSLVEAIDSVKTDVSALVPYFKTTSSERWPGTDKSSAPERTMAYWVSVRDKLDTYFIEIAGSGPEKEIPGRLCELLDRARAAFELISGLSHHEKRDATQPMITSEDLA